MMDWGCFSIGSTAYDEGNEVWGEQNLSWLFCDEVAWIAPSLMTQKVSAAPSYSGADV